jgi:23S rRNA pseudouridine2605 synthase
LARVLELPSTGWMRRYRVRAHGRLEQKTLDVLKRGVSIGGMVYGAMEAEIDRVQGSNVWLTIGLREGKKREVRRVLEHLGLTVSRLIRISYGPFQLGDLAPREVREVRGRVLRDQLGEKLARAADADFAAPAREGGRGAKAAQATQRQQPWESKPRRNVHAHRRRAP